MAKTKDIKRKVRNLALKERRLKAQARAMGLAAQDLFDSDQKRTEYLAAEFDRGFKDGWRQGALAAAEQCLDKTKEFKTVSSIRRSVGAIVRRYRSEWLV